MDLTQLDIFVKDLLHIDEATKNKLVDLGAGDGKKTFFLGHKLHPDLSAYLIGLASSHVGKSVGNTVMRGSARAGGREQVLGGYNDVEWQDALGERDPARLDSFIGDIYKEIRLKGNNPLFLSIGALRWKISVAQDKTKEVLTPILIFPVRLIRSGDKSIPVYIEFVNDDVYLNPCLIAKLRQVWGDSVADLFPMPDGCASEDDPVDLLRLGDGTAYFTALERYAARLKEGGEDTLFSVERNLSAIAEYRHDEICAYYDIRKNKDKIEKSELIKRVFSESDLPAAKKTDKGKPPVCILPRDSVQEEMISLATRGESFIIKGPPGTGKTLTIANMIAALLAEGKRVVFSSKKLSALSEVYGKLPERLRPFVMLLDGETETQTARTDPMEIKRELKELLERRTRFTRSDEEIYGTRARALNDIAKGIDTLTEYNKVMFTEGPLGIDYYRALDGLCKLSVEPVPLPANETLALDAVHFASVSSRVSEAGAQFERLTVGETIPISRNPWFFESKPADEDKAYSELYTLSALLSESFTAIDGCFRENGADGSKLPVTAFASLQALPDEAVTALTEETDVSALERLLSEEEPVCTLSCTLPPETDAEDILQELTECVADGALTAEEAELFSRNAETLARLKGTEAVKAFRGAAEMLKALREEERALLEKAGEVFRLPLTEENEALVLRAASHLGKYVGADRPKALDFAAKKDFRKLLPLSYYPGVKFADAVNAVVAFRDARTLRDGKIEETRSVFARLFRCEFTPENEECARILYERAEDPAGYAERSAASREILSRASEPLNGKDISFSELLAFYRRECLKRAIERELHALAERLSFSLTSWGRREARAILSAKALLSYPEISSLPAEKRVALYKKLCELSPAIDSSLTRLSAFGQTYFSGYYTCEKPTFSLGEIPLFRELSSDRGMLGAAKRYCELKEDVLISAFFAPFEGGRPREGHTFGELFEHAVYAVLCERGAQACGALRNGLGQAVCDTGEAWRKGREALERSDLAFLEGLLMASIDPKDPEFGFVESQRGGPDTLRRLFKQFPSALLKLKHCYILSPSSVSVLFGKEEYSSFDTVIIDEASQLEPTSALPVLFRTKQCILVGDEFQMPPIKHFASTSEKKITGEDGEETVYEAEISVLSLALRNRSFPVRELKCHYRSKTEALIAFSQGKYYPNMRTFPATVPFSENVGFRDRYVEDGKCVRGVNRAEAEEVVRLLSEHFNRFYRDGALSESVGIVAFGEAQIEEIKALVARDRQLSEKIEQAFRTFGDLEEKLVFFKTIETVQGQETDHLILSLTYGKNAEGKTVQSFGQMNRGALGQCIFNVAVTRARCSVTVVHSVHAHEITGENVSYIGEYLSYAERFAREGIGQFVSNEPDAGFLRSVGDFLAENGVPRERIVYNYGVTKGSVRIPIAVLSEDGREAELGIKCETPVPAKDYLDENVLFYESLKERGWNFYRVFAHDWVDNREAERKKLLSAVKQYVK